MEKDVGQVEAWRAQAVEMIVDLKERHDERAVIVVPDAGPIPSVVKGEEPLTERNGASKIEIVPEKTALQGRCIDGEDTSG